MNDDLVEINEQSFAPYRNLGGYDYLGKTKEQLTPEIIEDLARCVQKHGVTGLILVGATHTLTDCCKVQEFFNTNNVKCDAVVVPATLDGNVRHKYIETTLGFDTASKVYS